MGRIRKFLLRFVTFKVTLSTLGNIYGPTERNWDFKARSSDGGLLPMTEAYLNRRFKSSLEKLQYLDPFHVVATVSARRRKSSLKLQYWKTDSERGTVLYRDYNGTAVEFCCSYFRFVFRGYPKRFYVTFEEVKE